MKRFILAIISVMLPLAMFGQTRISGKVIDSNGEPVAGVAVFVRGTSVATSTNVDGTYNISAKENDNLLFSCIGYEDAVVPVGKNAVIDITLADDVELLEGVVVTGYQTISKERATGSFDIVNKAQIEKPTANIASRLIGAAPGLAYSQDVYGNPTFQIRGASSFSQSAQPLIVVDGFPMEGSINDLNPNDVESVTILKDAAAASIWGAKSANGVIVITTKNAKATGSDKPVVNVEYSGFYKVSPKLDLDYTLSQASSSDVIDFEINAFDKGWADGSHPTEDVPTRYERSQVYDLLLAAEQGYMSKESAMSQINALRTKSNRSQLYDYLLQNASTHQDNVNISIATKNSQTSISLLYQKDNLVNKGDANTKYNISMRNRTSLFKWLDLNLNAYYNVANSVNNGHGVFLTQNAQRVSFAPYEMLVDENGDYVRYSGMVNPAYLAKYVDMSQFPYQDWTWNPIEEQENRDLTSRTSTARFQGGLTFKPVKGLTIDAKIQYEQIMSRTHNYYSDKTYEVRNTVNSAATWMQDTGEVISNLPKGGFLDQSLSQRDVVTARLQANYNRTFAEKHTVVAVAGVEATDNVLQNFGYPRTYGYDQDKLSVGTFPHGTGDGTYMNAIWDWDTYEVIGTEMIDPYLLDWLGYNQVFSYVNTFSSYTDRYFSAFANASYTYDNKYTVSGSVRTDASNLITDDPAYRYAPFWSLGASWQLGKEEFMEDAAWLDMLNIRATFGHNGNVDKSTTFKPLLNPSPSPSVITHENTIGVFPDSNPGGVASYGNPTLRWERTETFDFGFDFSALSSKVRGKFDIYNKHSYDLIANVTLPNVMGTSKMALNNGEINNSGFEFELGSTIPVNKDIVWDGNLMFSYNKNVVKHLEQKPTNAYAYVYSSNSNPSSGWMEGKDMNTLWCYEYGGLINNGTDASPDMQPTIVGKDGTKQVLSKWPTGDAESISYDMGTKVAPVNVSFSTSLKLYDFDISMIFTGKFGHKFLRESFNYPGFSNGRGIPNAKYSEIKNCDGSEMVPMPLNDNDGGFDFWDRFYPYMSYLAANASFIRCQEINLTYNLPKSICNKISAKSLQVFVQANNPFNIYFNKWNEDSEFKRGSVRLQSAYMFGVKCNF